MKRYAILIIGVALVIPVVLFSVRNTRALTVDFVVAEPEAPVVVWLLLALITGALLTLVCLLPSRWRRRRENRRLRREFEAMRDECNRLRRAPLRDR